MNRLPPFGALEAYHPLLTTSKKAPTPAEESDEQKLARVVRWYWQEKHTVKLQKSAIICRHQQQTYEIDLRFNF